MLVALLEDESFWAEEVGAVISRAGFHLIWHDTPEAMLADPRALCADVMISDIHLAGSEANGRDFVRTLRARNIATPIMMLTQFPEQHRAAESFAVAADDYLAKPFDPDELLGRICALERRSRVADYRAVRVDALKLSPEFRVAYWTDRKIAPLTDQSFRLLLCLAETPRQSVSREQLWKRCWSKWENLALQPSVLDAAISTLRREVAAYLPKDAIVTVRGKGYKLMLGTE